MMNAREAFGRSYLVCGLDEAAVQLVWEMASIETFLARETLLKAEDRSCDLYLLLDGHVQI